MSARFEIHLVCADGTWVRAGDTECHLWLPVDRPEGGLKNRRFTSQVGARSYIQNWLLDPPAGASIEVVPVWRCSNCGAPAPCSACLK